MNFLYPQPYPVSLRSWWDFPVVCHAYFDLLSAFFPPIPATSLIMNLPLQFGTAIRVNPESETTILSVLWPESKIRINESGHPGQSHLISIYTLFRFLFVSFKCQLFLHVNIFSVGGESAIHLPYVPWVNLWDIAVELSDNEWNIGDFLDLGHYSKG